jgi:hypothetical protein
MNTSATIRSKEENMMRTRLCIFSILLVFAMLCSTAGSAVAAPLSGGPVVSAPSGGGTVSTTLIPVSKLPGTVANGEGTIFPQGHVSGDMMFDGDGVRVSGLVGYATINFTLSKYAYGWSGSVYQYLNEQWTKLPTILTPIAESKNAAATATIYSDGIYALIVGYQEPDIEVMKQCSNIDRVYISFEIIEAQSLIRVSRVILYPQIASGTPVTYKIIDFDPSSGFYLYSGSTTGRGTTVDAFEGWIGDISSVTFTEENYFRYGGAARDSVFTVRLIIGGCYLDVVYPDGFGA